jgi:2-polyprenyl-6-methoxyphenol hydroxylase-like FAD-dependent oxidoreductase
MPGKPRIAVAGAGIGGATLGILLQRAGYDCQVYEQAPSMARVGAGINLAPNSTRIFRELGLEPQMRSIGIQARLKFSRAWDSGRVLFTVPVPELVERYGAPFFAFHRGDLAEVLTSALKPGTVHWGKRVTGLDTHGDTVRLGFADGTSAEADAVVGADGVHSKVRELALGAPQPTYHGLTAYRAVFPVDRVRNVPLDDNCKWWAPDRYFLNYFMSERRDELYWITGTPQAWPHEDFAPRPGDLDTVRRAHDGFHVDVQRMIDGATSCTAWAMLEGEPFRPWSEGPVVLLGDACHATTPHMGQGAGMALEDAVVLARCLESTNQDLRRAFQLYEDTRFERCTRIQRESHRNEWTKTGMDHSWVYGYDCLTTPLGVREASRV